MSVQVKRRRESAAFLASFVGAQGELIVDTTNNRVQVHDGVTPGGFPAAKLSDLPALSGLAGSGANANITSLSGLTTPLSVAQGGTGAATAAGGRAALNAAMAGANADITALSALTSINAGPLAGLRNRVRNGNFAVNQRAVAGSVVLAAGAYGHDGVKAGASGAAYTFALSGIDTILTITSGSLVLPLDGTQIEGGAYVLSWTGTATARIYQGTPAGSYAPGPLAATGMLANTPIMAEFSAGTVSLVQFETGSVATPFERRGYALELLLSQFYYAAGTYHVLGSAPAASGFFLADNVRFFPMRAVPAIAVAATFASNTGTVSVNTVTSNSATVVVPVVAANSFAEARGTWTASAEI